MKTRIPPALLQRFIDSTQCDPCTAVAYLFMKRSSEHDAAESLRVDVRGGLRQAPAGYVLREDWNNRAEVKAGRNEWGPIPQAELFFTGMQWAPAGVVHGWAYSVTFGKWRALVSFVGDPSRKLYTDGRRFEGAAQCV